MTCGGIQSYSGPSVLKVISATERGRERERVYTKGHREREGESLH